MGYSETLSIGHTSNDDGTYGKEIKLKHVVHSDGEEVLLMVDGLILDSFDAKTLRYIIRWLIVNTDVLK